MCLNIVDSFVIYTNVVCHNGMLLKQKQNRRTLEIPQFCESPLTARHHLSMISSIDMHTMSGSDEPRTTPMYMSSTVTGRCGSASVPSSSSTCSSCRPQDEALAGASVGGTFPRPSVLCTKSRRNAEGAYHTPTLSRWLGEGTDEAAFSEVLFSRTVGPRDQQVNDPTREQYPLKNGGNDHKEIWLLETASLGTLQQRCVSQFGTTMLT
jgi:hypothetical protein